MSAVGERAAIATLMPFSLSPNNMPQYAFGVRIQRAHFNMKSSKLSRMNNIILALLDI
ncbi:hypothetical protein LR48_Vigan03g110700 [Vigna angularis]|uniref:Uncharacterized protein n=1 Tax=Phaseolus angularis TaxID=3914 RepID=A0A0L9U4L0_PHAAN|nr:hypothetical protein LR48_Vigan03g110700 [Vigna angularis]